jgi:Malectin domain
VTKLVGGGCIYCIKMIPTKTSLRCLLICSFLISTQGQDFSPIRINVGGPSFTELSSSRKWQDDTAFVVGGRGKPVNSCTNSAITISNLTTSAAPRDVYCTYRLFRKNIDVGPFTFRIPVLNTTVAGNFYRVRMHFAELVR